jgi:hypothetical protein
MEYLQICEHNRFELILNYKEEFIFKNINDKEEEHKRDIYIYCTLKINKKEKKIDFVSFYLYDLVGGHDNII